MTLEDTKKVTELHREDSVNEHLALGWVLIGMKYENSVYVLAWQQDGEPPLTESQKATNELIRRGRVITA
jgi:hypothetical protein